MLLRLRFAFRAIFSASACFRSSFAIENTRRDMASASRLRSVSYLRVGTALIRHKKQAEAAEQRKNQLENSEKKPDNTQPVAASDPPDSSNVSKQGWREAKNKSPNDEFITAYDKRENEQQMHPQPDNTANGKANEDTVTQSASPKPQPKKDRSKLSDEKRKLREKQGDAAEKRIRKAAEEKSKPLRPEWTAETLVPPQGQQTVNVASNKTELNSTLYSSPRPTPK